MIKKSKWIVITLLISISIIVCILGAATVISLDESTFSGPIGLLLGALILGFISFGIKNHDQDKTVTT